MDSPNQTSQCVKERRPAWVNICFFNCTNFYILTRFLSFLQSNEQSFKTKLSVDVCAAHPVRAALLRPPACPPGSFSAAGWLTSTRGGAGLPVLCLLHPGCAAPSSRAGCCWASVWRVKIQTQRRNGLMFRSNRWNSEDKNPQAVGLMQLKHCAPRLCSVSGPDCRIRLWWRVSSQINPPSSPPGSCLYTSVSQ